LNEMRLAYGRGTVDESRLRDAERDLQLLDWSSGYCRSSGDRRAGTAVRGKAGSS
jgi:hypothetical protein